MLPGSRKAHVGRRRGVGGEGRAGAEERSCSHPGVGAPGGGERGRRALQGRLVVILPHGVRQRSGRRAANGRVLQAGGSFRLVLGHEILEVHGVTFMQVPRMCQRIEREQWCRGPKLTHVGAYL
jgi:hypothetical protein